LESCSFVQTIKPSVNLNYGAHDFRRDSAHYRACSFSIVKPSVKVITIEPSADALSAGEVVKLFSMAFEQTCALKEVQPITLQRI
jgi:hypothetical protein